MLTLLKWLSIRFNRGKYNRYITYQNPTDAVTSGSKSRTWSTAFTGWAKLNQSTGNASEESGQRTGELTQKWLMPYNPSVRVDGRFYDEEANYYYVTGINEIEFRVELELQTVRR